MPFQYAYLSDWHFKIKRINSCNITNSNYSFNLVVSALAKKYVWIFFQLANYLNCSLSLIICHGKKSFQVHLDLQCQGRQNRKSRHAKGLPINYIEYFDSQVGIFTRFCKGRKGIWAFLENFIPAPLKVISAGTKWARQEVEESSCAPNKHKIFFFQRFELEHKD